MHDTHSSKKSLASSIASLPKTQREQLINSLSPEESKILNNEWRFWARPEQLIPETHWSIWLILAGRGFGKTRVISQTALEKVETGEAKRIGLIAPTNHDARKVSIEGESGILACCPPWLKYEYRPSQKEIVFENGAIITAYSAEEPDRLRGPQHDLLICDELAAWKKMEAWHIAQFGLRLGDNPRAIIATTPRPIPILKELLNQKDVHVTRGSTYDNAVNLPQAYFDKVVAPYEGTRLGRQELYAEILDDAPGALWNRILLEETRVSSAPSFHRIIIGVDPAVSSNDKSAETGIVTVGLGIDGHLYVLDDSSLTKASPDEWGKQVVSTYKKQNATLIVGEVNNGGDLIESNIKTQDIDVAFKQVRATRSKELRAQPIVSLYEQKKVHHVGYFGRLEDQMCSWEPGISKSPDRIDALIWSCLELLPQITNGQIPRIIRGGSRYSGNDKFRSRTGIRR